MSIQFRSRIKPAFNYSNTLNSYGYCCSTTSPGQPTRKSFLECFNEGGYFMPSIDGQIPTCPDPDTALGCCCSCRYVTDGDFPLIPAYSSSNQNQYLLSGTRDNVNKCTCDRLNGKWTAGPCPSLPMTTPDLNNFCIKGNIDVRSPRSCCHLAFDDVYGWPIGVKCTEVCNSSECAALSNNTYPSVYGGDHSDPNLDTRCSPYRIIPSSPPGATCQNLPTLSLISNVNVGLEVGSCFELEDIDGTYEYNCRLTNQENCLGYWVEQQNSGQTLYCNISQQPANPVKLGRFYDVQRMSLESFTTLNLTPGDRFQGGIYIGIFNTPHSGQSSKVLGNISFGTPTLSRFESDNVGTHSDVRWALISEEKGFTVPFLIPNETDVNYETSLFDGYYNTYGNNDDFEGIQTALTSTIKYKVRGGFIDWYLPSIQELNFYAAYLQSKNISNRGILLSSSFFSAKYIGSQSNVNQINNSTFVYGQQILNNARVNYKNILTSKYTVQNLVLFRKIVLT